MFHKPVLLHEAIDLLVADTSGVYVDGTLGGGGHTHALLERIEPGGTVLGIDRDRSAIDFAQGRLKGYENFIARQGNFSDFGAVLHELQIEKIHGLLLDLGISSHQIDTAERGFSFDREGKLDMRMNRGQELTAYEIVNTCSEDELAHIFKTYGEEKRHRSIARRIVEQRESGQITSTAQLKKIISGVMPFQQRAKSLARVFQALRIHVNEELQSLSSVLESVFDFMASGARLVVIAYHSLEDRIVKEFMKTEAKGCICPPELPQCVCGKTPRVKILTKRPVRPSDAEVKQNPRSRSARLRAAEIL